MRSRPVCAPAPPWRAFGPPRRLGAQGGFRTRPLCLLPAIRDAQLPCVRLVVEGPLNETSRPSCTIPMLSPTGVTRPSDGLLPEVRTLMRQAHGIERGMVNDRGNEGRQGVCAPIPRPKAGSAGCQSSDCNIDRGVTLSGGAMRTRQSRTLQRALLHDVRQCGSDDEYIPLAEVVMKRRVLRNSNT